MFVLAWCWDENGDDETIERCSALLYRALSQAEWNSGKNTLQY